jgi:glycosyltransferase involved in cell wall biosynthesis
LVKQMQPELKVRKILGKTYLNENRLTDALDVFSRILADYPDDLETLHILGNFYLASGDGKTAKSIYLHAQKLDPENMIIQHQISLAEEAVNDVEFEEPVPTDLPAVARLLQRLTGKTQAIHEKDIMRAALLLEKIINSDSPAELVSKHLDEIDELLPALIELNIRQATADGRSDLAESLRSLQLNIDYQLVAKDDGASLADANRSFPNPQFNGSILMLLPDLEKKSNRMALLKTTLEANGCRLTEKGEYVAGRDAKPDVVITSNPHTNPMLLESLSALSAEGIPIIVDLDTDFEKQPVSHHDYNIKGLGNQARSNAYNSAISMARMVVVRSDVHAASLKALTANVFVIPDGWSQKNKLWSKSSNSRKTINIGWAGTSGQLEDLLLIRRFIVRIVREFPDTRIVIIGNPQAYRLFENLPENRRLYLPEVAHEEFPYLLSQLDILLVPLRTISYNISLPDTILMEVGAKGIPWIASPISSFRHWHAGGVIPESLDEWHPNLRHLIMDDEFRRTLGEAGKHAARSREMNHLGRLWLEIISQAANASKINSSFVEPEK